MKKRTKKYIAAFLAILMMCQQPWGPGMAYAMETEAYTVMEQQDGSAYATKNYEAEFQVDTEWETGYNGRITIRNISEKAIDNWYLTFETDDVIQNLQSGSIMAHEGKAYLIKNAGWNRDIPAGESVSFTYTAIKSGTEISAPAGYTMNTALLEVPDDCYTAQFQIQSDWGSGFTAALIITNTSEEIVSDWKLSFCFDGEISEIVGGDTAISENGFYEVEAYAYDQEILPGESRSIQIIGIRRDSSVIPTDVTLKTVEYLAPDDREPEEEPPAENQPAEEPENEGYQTEIEKLRELNGGELPVMYLDEEDDIPCFIDGRYSDKKVENIEDAVDSLKDITHLMNIDWETTSFEGVSVKSYKDTVHFRLQQQYKGLEVSTRQIIVTTDTEGRITALSGNFDPIYYKDATPAICMEEAQKAAEEILGGAAEEGMLVWYSIEEGYDEPAWYFEGNDRCVYISGEWGDSLLTYPLVPANAAEDREAVRISLSENEDFIAQYDDENEVYLLSDPIRRIEICGKDNPEWGIGLSGYKVSYSSTDNWQCKEDAYAMLYTAQTYDCYAKILGITGYDNAGGIIRVTRTDYVGDGTWTGQANPMQSYYYTDADDNTFSGAMAVIDCGNSYYDEMYRDSVAHEYSHLIEMDILGDYGLILSRKSGAIKEAFADIMAELIDCYYGDEEWKGFERDVKNLKKRERSGDGETYGQSRTEDYTEEMPDSVRSSFYGTETLAEDYGHIHQNSTVISHTIYKLYESGYADVPTMMELMYRSIHYLSKDASYKDYYYAVLKAAGEMNLDKEPVKQAFKAAGIRAKRYNVYRDKVELTIQVTDQADNPLQHACVSYAEGGMQYKYYTDAEGILKLWIYDEDVKMNVAYANYDDWDVVYKQGQYDRQFDVQLEKISGTEKNKVKGVVKDSITNEGIEGAVLRLREGICVKSGQYFRCDGQIVVVTTDTDGSYHVDGLPYGMYTMEVKKDGYIVQYENVLVTNPAYVKQESIPVFLTTRTLDNQYRVVLTWGANPRDLDSHLICSKEGQEQYHIHCRNTAKEDIASLDRDDVDGFGPETLTFLFESGYDYKYFVNWYAGSGMWNTSEARVRVYYEDEQVADIGVGHLRGSGGDWEVFTIKEGVLYLR